MQNTVTDHAPLIPDAEVFLDDDGSLSLLSAMPPTPGLGERLRRLESERQEAYSQMHRMVADIGSLRRGHDRWVRDLERVQTDAYFRLALVAEHRSGGGAAKVLRIGVMSALVAHAMDCEAHFCECLQAAAPLHDIGEIALPDVLLNAPVLSSIERELMRSHCRAGHALLVDSPGAEIAMAADIALTHHERFDGGGYPNHLAGEAIPLAGRIVAVVDCFDALTLKRPYRAAYLPAVAAEMVLAANGSQFDPAVIEAFRRVLESIQLVRWVLDDNNPRPEAARWLGKPPESGLWRRFL